jgi:5-aminolevulinate synthase
MGALESIRILRSDEGRALRETHKLNVTYLREKLFDAGIWARHTPSHIIPVHVSFAPFPEAAMLSLFDQHPM